MHMILFYVHLNLWNIWNERNITEKIGEYTYKIIEAKKCEIIIERNIKIW